MDIVRVTATGTSTAPDAISPAATLSPATITWARKTRPIRASVLHVGAPRVLVTQVRS